MKSENFVKFEALSNDEYINFLEIARLYHEMGLLLDKSIVQLAKIMYETEVKNESKKY
jgi:hypothetical protein